MRVPTKNIVDFRHRVKDGTILVLPGTVVPITQNRAKHRTSMLCLGGGFGGASGSRIAQCRQKSLDGPVSELHAENLMSRSLGSNLVR